LADGSSNAVPEIEELISAGVNIKAEGKSGMTPLLWTIPGRNIDVFSLLLRSGANPNLRIRGELGPQRTLRVGDCVTSYAAETDVAYLKLVLEHGGDPEFRDARGETLLHRIVRHGGSEKEDYDRLLKYLTEHGDAVADAQKDLDRWATWPTWNPTAMNTLREIEVAERKRRQPKPSDLIDESTQAATVARNGMIVQPALHNTPQPAARFAERVMHTFPQLLFDLL